MHGIFVVGRQSLMYYIIWIMFNIKFILRLEQAMLFTLMYITLMYEETFGFANDCTPSDALINSNAIEDQNLRYKYYDALAGL